MRDQFAVAALRAQARWLSRDLRFGVNAENFPGHVFLADARWVGI